MNIYMDEYLLGYMTLWKTMLPVGCCYKFSYKLLIMLFPQRLRLTFLAV